MVKYYIILISSFFIFSCGINFSKNDIMKTNVYGQVIQKYQDENNHGAPTIVCKNKNGQFKYQVSDWVINADLWDYMQTGDSVIKPSGTLILRVKKANGEYKDYKYQR